jgi:hypothetical protein
MSGKSAILRQTALIVPACANGLFLFLKGRMGIVDKYLLE